MQRSWVIVSICIALSLCSWALGDETQTEEEILAASRVREVIRAMNDAIEREDAGAYMLHIDPSQPTFITEQRAWITDAISEGVQGLEYTFFGGMGASQKAPDEIWAGIGIRWSLDDSTAEDDDIWNMIYIAKFVPLASPDGVWVFAGPNWHFDLYDEQTNVQVLGTEFHEEVARLALERAPHILTRIEKDFGRDLDADLVIKIYKKMKSLQASISPAYTDPLSGWNEPGESIKILGRKDFPKHRLDPLLAHEIGHAVSFEFGPHIIDAPWWTLEGIAEVAAGLFRDSWESRHKRIVKLAKEDNLRDWSLLADFRGEANNHARHVYLQGWSMIDYIDRTFGLDARNHWFTILASGASLQDASQQALAISFDDLDAQWHQSLLDWNPSAEPDPQSAEPEPVPEPENATEDSD